MFDIITIGSATRDAFMRSKDFRVVSDAAAATGRSLALSLGAKLEIHDLVFTTGGGATNTAVTFSRQGFKTATVCAVGDDVAGLAVIEELKREGIETRFVRRVPRHPTGYSVLLHPASAQITGVESA